MLEEEIVARRGFWRRQRDKEIELTSHEFTIAVKILFQAEQVCNVVRRYTEVDWCFYADN